MKEKTRSDEYWMNQALLFARKAESVGEVPIGAILMHKEKLIAGSYNQNIGLCDPTAHAEINVLRQAGHILQNHRLTGTTLYVTLEPCYMCLVAAIHARVERLVFGAHDSQHSSADFLQTYAFNHTLKQEGGILEDQCRQILLDFFAMRR